MKLFCPKCGSEKGPFINHLCKSCYSEENELAVVPRKMLLPKCKRCGLILVKRHWVEESNEKIKVFLADNIRKFYVDDCSLEAKLEKDFIGYKGKVCISGKAFGKNVDKTYELEIRYEQKQCDQCKKKASSYYEAEIQIRADKETTEKIIYFIESLNEIEKRDIVKKIKNKRGADIFVISNRSAKKIAKAIERSFKTCFKASSTLRGINKNGKEQLRHTYLVRTANK
ncbi:MAG: 60S ribosomal export protein NMD3 [Candidatus Diapherotrites archaeon]|nr:60S ribosomal export protein NMD3 [Candidatus Diapherotrites archaeon]